VDLVVEVVLQDAHVVWVVTVYTGVEFYKEKKMGKGLTNARDKILNELWACRRRNP